MTMTTAQFTQLVAPGLNKVIYTSYNEYPPEYSDVFNVSSSKRNYEKDVTIGGLGIAPKKGEGESADFTDAVQGYATTYTHEAYKYGIRLTEELIEDDLYNIVNGPGGKLATMLGISFRQAKEIAGANIFNNAFATLGADGVVLCATNHPLKKSGGTYANRPTNHVDLSVTALQAAVENMELTQDDAGNTMFRKAMILYLPIQLQWAAKEILGSPQAPYTANNQINALRDKGMSAVVNHYLTDTDAWFVLSDKSNHSLRLFDRIPFETKWFDEPKTGDMLCRGRSRFIFGWSDWRGVYGTAGI